MPRTTIKDSTVPEEMVRIRKRLGWTQEELGRHLGVSFYTISRWENRRSHMLHPLIIRLALEALMDHYGIASLSRTRLPRRARPRRIIPRYATTSPSS